MDRRPHRPIAQDLGVNGPPKVKRAAPDRATHDTTSHKGNNSPLPLGAQADVTPFAVAGNIGNAQIGVQRAALEFVANRVTPELHGHLVAAERALGAAVCAVDYILAEVGAP